MAAPPTISLGYPLHIARSTVCLCPRRGDLRREAINPICPAPSHAWDESREKD